MKDHRVISTDDLIMQERNSTLTDEGRLLLERRRTTEKEVNNPNNYKHMIKMNCCVCGLKIGNSWEWYRMHGNYCLQCKHKGL